MRVYERESAEAAIDESANLLIAFIQTVRHATIQKDAILRGDGINFPPEHDFGTWTDLSPADIAHQTAAIKQALFPAGASTSTASLSDSKAGVDAPKSTYQVALSFAGEQRSYVSAVAHALQARGISVFYDEFEALTLWGKDGIEFFHQLFAADASYVVMFISNEYVNKKWTRHERRAALSRAIAEEHEYVLPVRFDDTRGAERDELRVRFAIQPDRSPSFGAYSDDASA